MAMTEKHRLLIAVDGSKSSMDAVRYVSRFHDPEKTGVTLIHILAAAPEPIEDYKNLPSYDAPAIETGAWQSEMADRIRAFMAAAENVLTDAGYDKPAISVHIRKREKGVAKDIIAESAGGYGAVFVGRRGMNDPTDIIVGATAYRMVSGISHLPVVVVGDKPDPGHVLIGFDGSENAARAVDCACALMPRPGRNVMLCHVIRSMNAAGDDRSIFSEKQEKGWIDNTRRQMDGAMQQAKDRLIAAGFAPERIGTNILEGRISRAVSIAKTAESCGCGTIVTGRRGLSVITDFLMGRVTMKILHKAHQMAVWIV